MPSEQLGPAISSLFGKFRFARSGGLRFAALRLLASVLCPSYRLRYGAVDWMTDEPFAQYLRTIGESSGFKGINAGRRWTVYQLLRLTDRVPGDTVECGVYFGASSYLICAFVARSALPKSHHLFDSFEGLSAPTAQDGSHWHASDLRVDHGEAALLLAKFKDVHFHKGWIPGRFNEVADRLFSFLPI
ncbi:MAG: TylF/MycF/NovP-related O-methyltransferase, partial [Terriglobia bacterium]